MHQHLPAPAELVVQRRAVMRALEDGRVDEVGDDIHASVAAAEGLDRLVLEPLRDGGDAVGALDREAGDRLVRVVLPDDGDVGAMQGGHDGERTALLFQHLLGDPGAGRMRDGVVDVQEVESLREHDVVHAHREREVVGRILEQRVVADAHLVEVHAREEVRQPERVLVRDEVDLMAARRERDPEFGGDGAGAAVRRIAGDADLHASTPVRNHRSARAGASGARGSSRSTADSSSS